MALIRCPECGKEISDKAGQCIHCGIPLQPRSSELNNPVLSDVDENLHLEFNNEGSIWIIDGDYINYWGGKIKIRDISFANISTPSFGKKTIFIKFNNDMVNLPVHNAPEEKIRMALRYIMLKSRCYSLQYTYNDLSETRLKCNVCKKIFCIQGNINSLRGISCPSCNSQNINYLENVDVPDTTLNVISFLLPIVGLILYLVKRDETPNKAKKIGEMALIGFIVGLLICWAMS